MIFDENKFTQVEYEAKYNVILDSLVSRGANESSNVDNAIQQACDDIIEYIELNDGGSFDKEDLEQAQIDIINIACMYQLTYILKNGYFKHKSGYDPFSGTNTTMPGVIDCEAIKLLNRKIIYRGLR